MPGGSLGDRHGEAAGAAEGGPECHGGILRGCSVTVPMPSQKPSWQDDAGCTALALALTRRPLLGVVPTARCVAEG